MDNPPKVCADMLVVAAELEKEGGETVERCATWAQVAGGAFEFEVARACTHVGLIDSDRKTKEVRS
jgi:hypothetical protein